MDKNVLLTTKDIVQQVVARNNISISKKALTEILDETFDTIIGLIISEYDIKLGKIGVLKPRTREAHVGRNPKTGESVQVPEKIVLKFTPSVSMKQLLKQED